MRFEFKSYNAEFWRNIGFYQPADEAFIRNWYDKIQTIWPTEVGDRFRIKDESEMSEAGRKERREARELINGTGSRFGARGIIMLFYLEQYVNHAVLIFTMFFPFHVQREPKPNHLNLNSPPNSHLDPTQTFAREFRPHALYPVRHVGLGFGV